MGQDRKEVDISQYEARLQTDWYTKTEELENMTVDVLARYMPRRMADEVHKILTLESPTGLRSFSIGKGETDDDDDGGKRVSRKRDTTESGSDT